MWCVAQSDELIFKCANINLWRPYVILMFDEAQKYRFLCHDIH